MINRLCQPLNLTMQEQHQPLAFVKHHVLDLLGAPLIVRQHQRPDQVLVLLGQL